MQDKRFTQEISKVLNASGTQPAAGVGAIAQAITTALAAPDGANPEVGSAATGSAGQSTLANVISQNTTQLAQVHSALQGQLDSLVANTQAVIDNTSRSAGSSTIRAASGLAGSILGGGLIGSLLSGLTSLVAGDKAQTPAPLVKFSLPPRLNFEAGVQSSGTGAIDYDQGGLPRASQPPRSPSSSAAQVTVNVSALDSRSFLDHSADIANAVRRAMLESNSLNDVIGDL